MIKSFSVYDFMFTISPSSFCQQIQASKQETRKKKERKKKKSVWKMGEREKSLTTRLLFT